MAPAAAAAVAAVNIDVLVITAPAILVVVTSWVVSWACTSGSASSMALKAAFSSMVRLLEVLL